MKERGILMHARSVQNILAGRKTQTRRIIKPQPDGMVNNLPFWEGLGVKFTPGGMPTGYATPRCPYGQPGDRLWVRETWRPFACSDDVTATMHIEYRADNGSRDRALCAHLEHDQFDGAFDRYIKPALVTETDSDGERTFMDNVPWRPSIHMPRWASRITLEITDIRVERVQEISDADIRAEGVLDVIEKDGEQFAINARPDWQRLWEDTNGKGAWERNEFVWIIDFKVVTP